MTGAAADGRSLSSQGFGAIPVKKTNRTVETLSALVLAALAYYLVADI